jgi:hypothetical protein
MTASDTIQQPRERIPRATADLPGDGGREASLFSSERAELPPDT